jgi:hypothetical protein
MQESKGQSNSRLPLNYAHDFMDYYVQFARAFSIPKGDLNSPLDRKHLVRALDHVIEEHDETMRAATAYLASGSLENLTEFADGIVDSIYVLCQAAYMFDIPLKEAFLEVHRSNMRKVGADGTIKRRADGKILKPEGWTPPNLWEVLHRYSNCRAAGAIEHLCADLADALAALPQAVRNERERCAKLCEEEACSWDEAYPRNDFEAGPQDGCDGCAARIRGA